MNSLQIYGKNWKEKFNLGEETVEPDLTFLFHTIHCDYILLNKIRFYLLK